MVTFRIMTIHDELQLARDEAARIIDSRSLTRLNQILEKNTKEDHFRDFIGLFIPSVLTTLLEKHVQENIPLEPEILAMMERLETIFQQIVNGREQFFLLLSRYSYGAIFGMLSQSLRHLEGDMARREQLAYIIDLIGSLHEICTFESPRLAQVIEQRLHDYQELDSWYHDRFRRFKTILLELLDLLYLQEKDVITVTTRALSNWTDEIIYQTIADTIQSNQYLNDVFLDFCEQHHLNRSAVETSLLTVLNELKKRDVSPKTKRYIEMFLVSRHRLTLIRDHLPLMLFPIVPRKIVDHQSRTKPS